ncbi:MAG: glycoside hydrolase [Ignavibacteria bacterium]|jgi:alpha-amylase/alpha-mannosidase (GH57 family)|nr:glycoside hydrolase [Ignavibacteria bacterium]
MKPIKVAVLWHQHQPYYKYKGEFLLPWVRLHGVKDYYDLPALLNEFPQVKQTFNLVPSLMQQIEEYITNSTSDTVQELTRLQAKYLTNEQKSQILNQFFVLNHDNLVKPYERYNQLFINAFDQEQAIANWTTQDWLDLQVWYNLAWLGQLSRRAPFANRLFCKHRNFTEAEKIELLEFHKQILARIIPEMSRLQRLGQIEICVSPMYHPILPLLCDSNVSRETLPNGTLLNPQYKWTEDAINQIDMGIEMYQQYFAHSPKGMWPSEGSVSNDVLNIMATKGIQWVATDESVLANSLGDDYKATYKYFPNEVQTKDGAITVFFRDHSLSDKIGFLYSNWNSYDAACNFREDLFAIRNQIIDLHGEDALDSAVIPIILDGENCWEFYHDNGIHFFRDFFRMLSSNEEIETILFSEALNLPIPNFLPAISNIRAGSWINGNFAIWIGDEEDVTAWNYLSCVRKIADERRSEFSVQQYNEIIKEIYIAEGSDWFWWYGPEFDAPNRSDFDKMFRWHISNIYAMMGMTPPEELSNPIMKERNTYTGYSTMAKND